MTDEPTEPAAVPPAPVTGHHEIDRALTDLDLEAEDAPAAISAALDAVQNALSGPSVPQGLRPRP